MANKSRTRLRIGHAAHTSPTTARRSIRDYSHLQMRLSQTGTTSRGGW
jgi:hypothetical protein